MIDYALHFYRLQGILVEEDPGILSTVPQNYILNLNSSHSTIFFLAFELGVIQYFFGIDSFVFGICHIPWRHDSYCPPPCNLFFWILFRYLTTTLLEGKPPISRISRKRIIVHFPLCIQQDLLHESNLRLSWLFCSIYPLISAWNDAVRNLWWYHLHADVNVTCHIWQQLFFDLALSKHVHEQRTDELCWDGHDGCV